MQRVRALLGGFATVRKALRLSGSTSTRSRSSRAASGVRAELLRAMYTTPNVAVLSKSEKADLRLSAKPARSQPKSAQWCSAASRIGPSHKSPPVSPPSAISGPLNLSGLTSVIEANYKIQSEGLQAVKDSVENAAVSASTLDRTSCPYAARISLHGTAQPQNGL